MARSCLVTGAGSGLGRATAAELAARGYNVTVLDVDLKGLEETAALIRKASPSVNVAIGILDVTNPAAQKAAFQEHMARFGGLDVAVLNAGIGEKVPFFHQGSDASWRRTLEIDLTAVIDGVKAAADCMGKGGAIISVGSAGSFFPMPAAPVYAAAKAGVVHFTRSVARQLGQRGIRAMAVCPEFVDTPMVRGVMETDPAAARRLLGSLDVPLLSPERVAQLTCELLDPANKPGTVVLLRQDGSVHRPPIYGSKRAAAEGALAAPAGSQQQGAPAARPAAGPARAELAAWALARAHVPNKMHQVHRLSTRFREATCLIEAPAPLPSGTGRLPEGGVLVRRVWAGINASDINYTAGRYFGSPKQAQDKLPFGCGFESVGVVAAVGTGVTGIAPGDCVAALSYDAFAEYGVVPAKAALPVPRATPEIIALLTSGLTASIALEEAGRLTKGETVLVTAAAGGTGQFAVQLAKLAGCHVVATAGGKDKAAMVKALGADRVVDYKTEDLKAVLKREYPRGVDVVYESVGGSMFEAALSGLADKGRLVVIGMMSSYAEGWPLSTHPGLCERLLWKSASVVGFFLLRYAHLFRPHLARLQDLVDRGLLKVQIDPTPFVGIGSVPDAVDHLYSGNSVGKVVVALPPKGEMPPVASGSGSGSKL